MAGLFDFSQPAVAEIAPGTINPFLVMAARAAVEKSAAFDLRQVDRLNDSADRYLSKLAAEKSAIVPAGDPSQQPPSGDPSMGGGAPPPDPSMGAAPPAGDAQTQQVVAQVLQQIQAAGGGAGGPGGKGGGKKAEQMLLDVKLWQILNLLVQVAQAMGVKVDPSIVVGPAPDPALQQQAQQEQGMSGGGGATMQQPDAAGGAGGAAPGPAPIGPMDPSQGPIGKAASWDPCDIGIGSEFDAFGHITRPVASASPLSALAARARKAVGG